MRKSTLTRRQQNRDTEQRMLEAAVRRGESVEWKCELTDTDIRVGIQRERQLIAEAEAIAEGRRLRLALELEKQAGGKR